MANRCNHVYEAADAMRSALEPDYDVDQDDNYAMTPYSTDALAEPLLPMLEKDETPGRKYRSKWRKSLKKRCGKTCATFGLVNIAIVTLVIFLGWSKGRSADTTLTAANPPILVTLPGYGSFQGVHVVKSIVKKLAFQEPVHAWLGIDYSVQPVNGNRFAAPDWPEAFNGTRKATQYGKPCMQSSGTVISQQAEACLTFNVYRTGNVSMDTRLPVLIFLHGGAFVIGGGRSFDGASFVASSLQPLTVVTVQYRLGLLGSLPSQLFEDEGLLNLGLRDQHFLLEFMQKYIEYFGGDPERVTLAGQSAGAHSAGIHLFHKYGSNQKKLFRQVILASGAPTARSFPPATYSLYQRQFQSTMTFLGCSTSGSNQEQLECLRAAPFDKLQEISFKTYKESNHNLTWPWQPVSPGPFLEKRGSQSGEDRTFYEMPTILTSTTDEGSMFVPHNLTSNTDFRNWWTNLLPGLTSDDQSDLDELYPDPSSTSDSPYRDSPISKQYNRIAAAYGDYAYTCPVQKTAELLADAGLPVYKARFNTPNGAPTWQGVPHASDAAYFNGLPGTPYPEISDLYSAYWASFVVSGDPNSFKRDARPTWERYSGVGSEQLVVGNPARGGVHMEKELTSLRMEQCRWWNDDSRMKRIYK